MSGANACAARDGHWYTDVQLPLHGVRGPDGPPVRPVDDHISVVLDDEVAAGMLPRAGVPEQMDIEVVDDEIPICLHDAGARGSARGARVPQCLPIAGAIQDQIAIGLIDEEVGTVG